MTIFTKYSNKLKLMKRFFYVIAIILVIVLGTYLQYIYCCGGDLFGAKPKTVVENTTKKVTNFKGFFVKDGAFSLKSNENFNFMPSSFTLMNPISESLKGTIGKLKGYILENPKKHLTIKGYYANFEKNNSIFPNLGIARANAVKKYFVEQGISDNNLHLAGESTDKIKEGQSPLRGIISYELAVLDDKVLSEQLKELTKFGEELKKNPLMVYFDSNASSLNLSKEERDKIQKIVDYLSQVDGSRLLIVGHSDKTGNAKKNKILAKERAEFIKKHFVHNGFDSKLIDVVSRGQEQPIASNKTKEGRAKNRRVEITLK